MTTFRASIELRGRFIATPCLQEPPLSLHIMALRTFNRGGWHSFDKVSFFSNYLIEGEVCIELSASFSPFSPDIPSEYPHLGHTKAIMTLDSVLTWRGFILD